MPSEITINIVTNTFGKYHRQNIAVESLGHLRKTFPDIVLASDYQFRDEANLEKEVYSELRTSYYLDKSSKELVGGKKKLPVVWEIIQKGFQSVNPDYVIFVNSDVILLPRLIEYILKEKPDCMAGPRLDIQEVQSFQEVLDGKVTPVRVEIAGYDFFVFSKEFYEKYGSHFDANFLMGKPLFDVDYAGLMVLFGEKCHIANQYPMMALHIHHGIDSVTTECPEKDWNVSEHNSRPLFKIANNIMFYNLQKNLCRRKPWGAFIQPHPEEYKFQEEFFNAVNIHKDNTIQFVQ